MEFIKKHYKLILFSIPLISVCLHWYVFNLDLIGIHVWRQTETQTVINNFYTEDFNILNPRRNQYADTNRLHRMEFPIMQWVFAVFYKIFGPHIIISRILSFIIGLCSVFGMFRLADNIFKNKVIATLCAWCFNWSPVFYYYTLNPMPDNLAMCFAIWSIAFFYKYINTTKAKYVVASAFFLCLASLAKLPFIIYGSFILTYVILSWIQRQDSRKRLLTIALIYFICIVPPAIWYVTVMPSWGIDTPKGIFDQHWNHLHLGNVLTGTLISVLPELLINYGAVFLFLAGFYFLFKNKLSSRKHFSLFFCWGTTLILYFIYEMNVIDLVHDYYLLPFLPAIFLVVSYGAYYLLKGNNLLKYLSLVCLFVLPFTAFIRAYSRWDAADPGFNPAYLKYKNELRQLTPKNSYCIVGNDPSSYILLYYIDRKGWAFNNDWFDEKMLDSYISKGAGYLFIDSGHDTLPGIKAHLDKKIFDKGTLRVYKLK